MELCKRARKESLPCHPSKYMSAGFSFIHCMFLDMYRPTVLHGNLRAENYVTLINFIYLYTGGTATAHSL